MDAIRLNMPKILIFTILGIIIIFFLAIFILIIDFIIHNFLLFIVLLIIAFLIMSFIKHRLRVGFNRLFVYNNGNSERKSYRNSDYIDVDYKKEDSDETN